MPSVLARLQEAGDLLASAQPDGPASALKILSGVVRDLARQVRVQKNTFTVSPRTVVLTLPMPPNIVNGSYMGHWSFRRKAVNDWKGRAIALERGLRGRPERMERATLAVVFYVGGNPLDDDNGTARLKPAIDLLKERGLIVDDKRPCLTLAGIPEQRAGSPRRVVLTLTEVLPT